MNLLTLIFGYFFSVSFFLFGFLISFASPLSGFLIITGSLLIFPKLTDQIRKFVWSKTGKYLPKFSLGITCFVLIFSSILVFSSPNSGQNGEVKGVKTVEKVSSSSSSFSSLFSSSSENFANNSEISSQNLAKSTENSQKVPDAVETAKPQEMVENQEILPNLGVEIQNLDKKLYQILEVVDGDTVKVSEIGTLRLIGIDTPETKDPRKVVQCFGVEASNNAKNLLSGQKVWLEYDETKSKVDKYGRTLAYIFREDGYFYNLEAVKNGFAHSYREYPHPKLDEFNLAEKQAREGKIGFWADNTCGGNTEQGAAGEVAKATVPPTGGTQEVVVEKPAEQVATGIVKKSTTGICHDTSSRSYERTKNFTPFDTIQECLASGGRLPLN